MHLFGSRLDKGNTSDTNDLGVARETPMVRRRARSTGTMQVVHKKKLTAALASASTYRTTLSTTCGRLVVVLDIKVSST